MTYRPQQVTLTGLERQSSGLLVTLTSNDLRGVELAPAFLFELTAVPQRDPVVVLEWLVRRDTTFCFEAAPELVPLQVGRTYGYQGFWDGNGYDAVADLGATWERAEYPDNGDHDHCVISFETISAYSGERFGYRNPAHGWITEEAHREQIVNDIYGIRRRLREGRKQYAATACGQGFFPR